MVQPPADRWSMKRPLGNDQWSVEAMEKVSNKDGEKGTGGVKVLENSIMQKKL